MVLVRKARAGWLRAQCEVAYVRVLMAAQRYADVLRREDKYRPDQPRVPAGNPDGGQWTDSGGEQRIAQAANAVRPVKRPEGNDIAEVQARRPGRDVRVGGRTYQVTSPEQETRLTLAAERAQLALNRVRSLDQAWSPAPQLSDPQTAEGAIGAFRALAQQAEARATVLERGGLPLGFNSMEQFRGFGWETRSALARSGNADADVYLRGSAVTGYSYRTGEAFDVGRRSDYDFAIISSRLLERAKELGITMTRNGERTLEKLSDRRLRAIGLDEVMTRMRYLSRKESSIMIYRDASSVEKRGPSVRLP